MLVMNSRINTYDLFKDYFNYFSYSYRYVVCLFVYETSLDYNYGGKMNMNEQNIDLLVNMSVEVKQERTEIRQGMQEINQSMQNIHQTQELMMQLIIDKIQIQQTFLQ